MTRIGWIAAALIAALACAGIYSYWQIDADTPAVAPIANAETRAAPAAVADDPWQDLPDSANNAPAKTVAPDQVAQLSAEATGDNARDRASAIEALATAPKAQAIPVLQKVLSGTVDEDRQLAVVSLRTLALDQGDAEGLIQNVLRMVIYDGNNNASVTDVAKAALEEIQTRIDQAPPGTEM